MSIRSKRNASCDEKNIFRYLRQINGRRKEDTIHYRYSIDEGDFAGGVVIAEDKKQALRQLEEAYTSRGRDFRGFEVRIWEAENDDFGDLYVNYNVIDCY